MSLNQKDINRIENFKKQDGLNNKLFIILMCMVVFFVAANIFAIMRLCSEYSLTFAQVMELTKHVEVYRNPEWYETHIIRRLGYIAMGLVIAIFFPIFYTMARGDMLTLSALYDKLRNYESADSSKNDKNTESQKTSEQASGKQGEA